MRDYRPGILDASKTVPVTAPLRTCIDVAPRLQALAVLCFGALVGAAACSLNPQPLPPGGDPTNSAGGSGFDSDDAGAAAAGDAGDAGDDAEGGVPAKVDAAGVDSGKEGGTHD